MPLATTLAHVLWIGGATDSGKTTLANLLTERNGWQVYHYDQFDRLVAPGHWARVDPGRHPHMSRAEVRDRTRQWVDPTPEAMVEEWLRTTPERFSMTLEDLASMPSEPAIVAEGYGLLPELVRPMIGSRTQAVWLVSTDEFKRATYKRRGKGAFSDTSDPARARRNHIARDLMLGRIIRDQALALDLTVLTIDGTRPLPEIVDIVESQFFRSLSRPEGLMADS